MTDLPLVPAGAPDAVIATAASGPVTRAMLCAHLNGLAEALRGRAKVINLCTDRYWFTVGLLAAIRCGAVTHLPNMGTEGAIVGLIASEGCDGVLWDAVAPPVDGIATFEVPRLAATRQHDADEVDIAASRIVVRLYTSGSTGAPRPHAKSFGNLVKVSRAEGSRLWSVTGQPCSVIGTVPFQHMYGLESTVLLPLYGGGLLSARRPYFPADFTAALAELPVPRLLVTTPFHLQKLLDEGVALGRVAAILSATAPLPAALAAAAEQRFSTRVLEIYGSTETGQLATRQPARESDWELYDGVRLALVDGAFEASGGHLDRPEPVADRLELVDARHFRLLGRNTDMLNLAGKRASLARLNEQLQAVPGVLDGVLFVPAGAAEGAGVTRLAAVVVAPGIPREAILASLRREIDPVFMPRPLVHVDALPRDDNGKVLASQLNALIGGRA